MAALATQRKVLVNCNGFARKELRLYWRRYRDCREAYIVLPLVVKLMGGISGDHGSALLPHVSSLLCIVYFVSCIFIDERDGVSVRRKLHCFVLLGPVTVLHSSDTVCNISKLVHNEKLQDSANLQKKNSL